MEAQGKTGGKPEKVGVGFAAVSSAYRAWVKHQREEGEGWRKMLESSGAEMMRDVKEHEASIDAQRTDLQRILRDFDREKLSRLDEKEEVMFDVLTYHKQKNLDEWEAPDDIWTMQAELWAETCTICRIREGTWADHHWQTCRKHQEDIESGAKSIRRRRRTFGVVDKQGADGIRRALRGLQTWQNLLLGQPRCTGVPVRGGGGEQRRGDFGDEPVVCR